MKNVGLPSYFYFELTDLYDKKNIPKVIYCIHALSHFLNKSGLGKHQFILAPSIQNLVGELNFTKEEIENQEKELVGVTMPVFHDVKGKLDQQLKTDTTKKDANIDPFAHLKEIADLKKIDLIQLQSAIRGTLARSGLKNIRKHIHDNYKTIILFQSVLRGYLIMNYFAKYIFSIHVSIPGLYIFQF